MYRMSDSLPVGAPRAVDPGTSVLVAGPPFSGQRERCLDVLAAGYDEGEGVVVVTADASAAAVEEAFHERTDDTSRLYVVETRSGATADQLGATGRHTFVSSPGDLTGIGMRLVRALAALQAQGVTRVRVGLHSVSTLLQYVEPAVVFQFLHTLAGRCAQTDLLFVATLNTTTHDPQTVGLVTSVFDTLVQFREVDDRLEARVATRDGPSPWTTVSAA